MKTASSHHYSSPSYTTEHSGWTRVNWLITLEFLPPLILEENRVYNGLNVTCASDTLILHAAISTGLHKRRPQCLERTHALTSTPTHWCNGNLPHLGSQLTAWLCKAVGENVFVWLDMQVGNHKTSSYEGKGHRLYIGCLTPVLGFHMELSSYC